MTNDKKIVKDLAKNLDSLLKPAIKDLNSLLINADNKTKTHFVNEFKKQGFAEDMVSLKKDGTISLKNIQDRI